jgi:alcohol dehydrogenase
VSWQFASAGSVVFGRGSSAEIGAYAQRLGITRAIVVTDATLSRLGMVDRLTASLDRSGCKTTVYDGCMPEPPLECATEATQLALKAGANGVVALGGGSNIDIAKMVAILVRHGGQPQDYFGFDRVTGPVLPLIACPTTAGTGSEVSNSSVLTDRAASTKVSSLSPYLRPSLALVDPDLTDSCPAAVSAHSGIDALVHAIEAITARSSEDIPGATQLERPYAGAYALTQLLGLEAVRLIGKSLKTAVHEGTNRAARDDMALAATLAGMAFSNSGVALVHALEYPIGALTHCSHGEGNGLLLPHVMRFNLQSRLSEFARIAEALSGQSGLTSNTSSAELTHKQHVIG